jgi:hypothetical protein
MYKWLCGTKEGVSAIVKCMLLTHIPFILLKDLAQAILLFMGFLKYYISFEKARKNYE